VHLGELGEPQLDLAAGGGDRAGRRHEGAGVRDSPDVLGRDARAFGDDLDELGTRVGQGGAERPQPLAVALGPMKCLARGNVRQREVAANGRGSPVEVAPR
jgi:hypothetical protein